MIESIPPLIIAAFIAVTTIAYCTLVMRIVSCGNRKPPRILATGYQPTEGPRPAPPSTGSGVVPPYAHNKTRSEHAGPSA